MNMRKEEFIAKHGPEAWQEYLAKKRAYNKTEKQKKYLREFRKRYNKEHTNFYGFPGVKKNADEYKAEHCCCELCGSTIKVEAHHLNKLAMWNWEEARNKYNLMALCKNCHTAYHKHKLNKNDTATIDDRKLKALVEMAMDAVSK